MQTRKLDRETAAMLEHMGIDQSTLPPMKQKKRDLAGPIQKKTIARLEALGCVVTRTNSGLFRSLYGNGKIVGCIPGWPDVTACGPNGKFVGCEVKAPGDTLKPEQRDILTRMRRNGALVGVVRDAAKDVDEILAGRGIIA
jgi:hypothetical protein